MEMTIQCLKDFDFSFLSEDIQVSDSDGNSGKIIALADHEKYPAIIIQWADGSIKSKFHFDSADIFFFRNWMTLSEKDSEEVVAFVKSLCNDKNQLDEFVKLCQDLSVFLKFFNDKIVNDEELFKNSKYLLEQISSMKNIKESLLFKYKLDIFQFEFFVQQFNLLSDIHKLILQKLNWRPWRTKRPWLYYFCKIEPNPQIWP